MTEFEAATLAYQYAGLWVAAVSGSLNVCLSDLGFG